MAAGELFGPVVRSHRRAACSRRRAISAACGLLVVCAITARLGSNVPLGSALSSAAGASLGGAASAQSVAKKAEGAVAQFLRAMKRSKEPATRSDAHALDWNWAPELERTAKVKTWVGRDWVRGGADIKKIARPRSGAGKHSMAAALGSIGLANKVTSKAKMEFDRLAPAAVQMPALQPLHYFGTSAGSVHDWNTNDAISQAKRSVDFVQEGFGRSGISQTAGHGGKGSAEATGAHIAAARASVQQPAAAAAAKGIASAGAATVQSVKDKPPSSVLAREKALQAKIARLETEVAKNQEVGP